uniref:Coiled-coil-helix-coiled-coil-helix domain containing 1 n=1 Tax=Oncorhynchus mykiss TaxID=8022 RepID=A0A8C7W5D1_ONCMY
MSMHGGTALQEEVVQMLSRKQKKNVLKPNKPLSLKDEVTGKLRKGIDAMCITEMSMMMACWKQNNFADALCSNEMQSFYKCIAVKAISEHHIIGQGGCFQPKQATTLLK